MPPADTPHIGYVVKSYPRFSETFIVNEVIAREEAGERISIAALRPTRDPRFHALLARVGAPVTWIPHRFNSLEQAWQAMDRLSQAGVRPGGTALRRWLTEEPSVAAQAAQLAAWALEAGITHLHAHFASVPGRTARVAAGLLDLPWTVTAHAKDIFHADNDPARLLPVLRDADRVVAVSDMTARWIGSLTAQARVRRVYNGVDLTELSWSSPLDRPMRVVSVSRLVPKKGLPDLVQAVALLRDQGLPVELDIAGEGPMREELTQLAAAPDLQGSVRLLGPIPQHEVVDLVRSAAVFAAPCVVAEDGDRDGLPTAVLEAMALGTPVVATPVAGIPEAVQDGRTGLLVPERDPQALAASLARLLNAPQTRQRLALAARQHIERQFDGRRAARALRELTADLTRQSERSIPVRGIPA